jgi:hypothetical protein
MHYPHMTSLCAFWEIGETIAGARKSVKTLDTEYLYEAKVARAVMLSHKEWESDDICHHHRLQLPPALCHLLFQN